MKYRLSGHFWRDQHKNGSATASVAASGNAATGIVLAWNDLCTAGAVPGHRGAELGGFGRWDNLKIGELRLSL